MEGISVFLLVKKCMRKVHPNSSSEFVDVDRESNLKVDTVG